jgi:hypothetical protein
MTPFKVLSLSLVVIVGFTCALIAAPEIFDGHHPALGWPIFAVFVLSCVTYLCALAKVDHGRGKTWIVLCALSFIVVPIGPIGGYLLTCTAVVRRERKHNRPTQEGAAVKLNLGIKAFIGAWLCWLSLCLLGSATHEMLNPTLAEILYKGVMSSGATLFLGTIYIVARGFINLFRRKSPPGEVEN